MDQTEKIGLVSAEVLMGEIPVFGFSCVRAKDTLLEMGNLVKSIHVELANEGSKVLVFEPPRKDFACETFMIKDFERFNGEEKREIKQTKERIRSVCPADEVLTMNVTQHSVSR